MKGYYKFPFEERKLYEETFVENSLNNQLSELNEEDMPMVYFFSPLAKAQAIAPPEMAVNTI